jgi:hypothetical protein
MRPFFLLILCTSLPIAVFLGQQSEGPLVDAMKAGASPYLTAKMENLTSKLSLTPDQQAKLKPIAEQEVNLMEEVRGQSGYTQKEKLVRLQKVVFESDKQMRPWLSAEQREKLQALRKDQKERLKQYTKTK